MSQTKTFFLPDLGEGLPDATIVEWFVKPGDTIKLDAPLVSMETAKAVVEVPSPVSGKVLKLAGGEGDVVVTGTMLAEFEIDPSMPQRAEGQDTGHHHGGGHAEAAKPQPAPSAPPPATKTEVLREDSGTVVGAMQILRCCAYRSRGRGRRRQSDARGARDGAQTRRGSIARTRQRRGRRGDDGRCEARSRRWFAVASLFYRKRGRIREYGYDPTLIRSDACRRRRAFFRSKKGRTNAHAAFRQRQTDTYAAAERVGHAVNPNNSKACAATWRA